MNAAIGSLVKVAIARNHDILGVRDGLSGLMEGWFKPLSRADVEGISRLGGTILGSARAKQFYEESGRDRARAQLAEAGVEGLVVIGGNGSLTGAHKLGEKGPCRVIGLPASIDNDIGHTLTAIGVDTAINTIVEACDRITDTATAHRRAFIVEVMGRDSGFLAMRAGLAGEADAILYGESGRSAEDIIAHVRAVIRRSFAPDRNKRRVLIVKAEGVAIPTSELVARLSEHVEEDAPGVEIRETVLGHVVRGGRPSQADRVVAQRLAFGAVLALETGAHDVMMGWEVPGGHGTPTRDSRVRMVPIADVLDETRRLIDGTSPVTQARIALIKQGEAMELM